MVFFEKEKVLATPLSCTFESVRNELPSLLFSPNALARKGKETWTQTSFWLVNSKRKRCNNNNNNNNNNVVIVISSSNSSSNNREIFSVDCIQAWKR